MRLLAATVCTVCCLLPLPSVATIPTAQAPEAAPLCSGLPATIVGTPETRRLRGTPEADVMVTGGARTVRALAGDDTVCITGRTFIVEAGPGGDQVSSDDRDVETIVRLDTGADTFIGGARTDLVSSGAGADHVETGAGDDSYAGYLSDQSEPDSDPMVSLGAGNDVASGYISNLTGVLDGGPGLNTLTLNHDCCGNGREIEWVVDNVTETAKGDGEPRFQWDRFRGFTFGEFNLTGTIEFEGSDASERVFAGGEFSSPRIARMDLRGGNDTLVYSRMLAPARLGEGRDWLRLVNFADPRSPESWAGPVTVDVEKDRVRLQGRTRRVSDVENVEVSDFLYAHLQGNAEDNHFIAGQTCLAELYGGRGDDTLRGRQIGDHCHRLADSPRAVRAFGGSGDDTLTGRWTADFLVGGPGEDRADGRSNTDVCKAEVRRRCER